MYGFDDFNQAEHNDVFISGTPDGNGHFGENSAGVPRTASFYTESYKKPSRRKFGIAQLLVISVISALLGGFVTGAFFTFVTPALTGPAKGYFQRMMQQTATPDGSQAKSQAQSQTAKTAPEYGKVEIIQSSDSTVTAIAEKVGPSVVGIRVTYKAQNFFFEDQQQTGEGSGIIIRSNGYILTNNHVIQAAINQRTRKLDLNAKIEVYLPSQKDKPYTASYIGSDAKTDLAILKIDAVNLPVAELGDSDKLKVGEMAVAIGNPGGLELMGSVTVGVISGLNRTIATEDGVNLKLIQTDAAINPGNSGGALVNSKGQVIGVNRIKVVQQGFEGLGFAIPVNLAKEVANNLIEFKYVKGRPLLGITPDPRYTEEVAKSNNMPAGVYVADVLLMSGAQKAGIQPGDIITKVDGQSVKTKDDLDNIKNKHKVGDTLNVEIYRDGETKTLQVVLGEDKN